MKTFPRVLIFTLLVTVIGCTGADQTMLPGKYPDGRILLSNGWYLSPAGRQVEVGDLPLNMDISPDGEFAIVTNNGEGVQSVSVVSLSNQEVVQTIPIAKSWLGIRFFDDGNRFAVSGGNDNRINLYDFDEGNAILADSILLGQPWPAEKLWIAGIDIDQQRRTLFAVTRQSEELYKVDLDSKQILGKIALGARAYTCLVSATRPLVYVSLWGGSGVAIVDRERLAVNKVIRVGDHPNDMVETRDGRFLFVANANDNTVSVIDLEAGKVIETLSSALYPKSPAGSTPNSVALSADEKRLYIANADNNYLAVMDVETPGRSLSVGFIPVGWYPTSVRVVPGTDQIVVANGKGGSSRANPRGPNPELRGRYEEYIGSLFKGTLSIIDAPDEEGIGRYTAETYVNTPYGKRRENVAHDETGNPIPQKAGDQSPIKYVFYIIKENRTYDQIFGDIPEGNGDSSLCLFPERVTPNHHALAREFVLFDNFYVDAEVSADGHNWSMGAYATDYVEKSWPTMYGGRGGNYDFEGGHPIASPSDGYLWDNCLRNGVSYRSYGEFVYNWKQEGDTVRAAVPALEGHTAPYYQGYNLNYSDLDRVKAWEAELEEFERSGDMPQLQIIRLPNDHTQGTRRGKPTPKAYLAQNDLALGLMVERITKSRFWNQSAIFVLEDDAQNGPDHVDAHRSIALIISPYVKRGFVDSEFYSTSGMLRTMELILGLPPMSQFDAAATPMHRAFTMSPDMRPYNHRPARHDLNEVNAPGAYGQLRSEQMNLSKEDSAPDIEFNEIIWKAVRGENSEMPAPVRSAFVKVTLDDDDD